MWSRAMRHSAGQNYIALDKLVNKARLFLHRNSMYNHPAPCGMAWDKNCIAMDKLVKL
jgi:hypothetical protein